jgi:hypothetical protein
MMYLSFLGCGAGCPAPVICESAAPHEIAHPAFAASKHEAPDQRSNRSARLIDLSPDFILGGDVDVGFAVDLNALVPVVPLGECCHELVLQIIRLFHDVSLSGFVGVSLTFYASIITQM